MIGFFKSLFKKCDHNYKKIDTDYKVYPNFETRQYEMATYYILYCPKCDKEKRVDAKKYDLDIEKQRLRSQRK